MRGLARGSRVLTALAVGLAENLPGPITPQGDHGLVEFRQIVLTPLVK